MFTENAELAWQATIQQQRFLTVHFVKAFEQFITRGGLAFVVVFIYKKYNLAGLGGLVLRFK